MHPNDRDLDMDRYYDKLADEHWSDETPLCSYCDREIDNDDDNCHHCAAENDQFEQHRDRDIDGY